MTIPKHDEIRFPALELLNTCDELRIKEFEAPLASHFGLTEEEVERKYDSGNAKIFYDRVTWALSHMSLAGIVQKPRRGVYQISLLGKQFLSTPGKLHSFIAEQLDKRDAGKKNKKVKVEVSSQDKTPQQELLESSQKIRQSVYDEILEEILRKSPREFEKLVVMLLEKMGYGGEVKSAGEVTQYTNDGGIDGIIKEDILGLGRIHIQAKRYNRDKSIGREDIQKFVGALAGAQSNKGVFITTSRYTQNALEYAANLNGATTLVLIDGEQLAEYIYDYGLGMQVEQTIEIKKLDSDFWDLMEEW